MKNPIHVAQNEIKSTPEKRLGRLPARSDPRALMFARFSTAPKKLPRRTNYWTKKTGFPLRNFGNTEWGDCTIAKQAQAALRMERIETRRLPKISDQEIIDTYRRMCVDVYGTEEDNGAYETDALDRWRRPETTFKDESGRSLTIDAYVRLNPFNHEELKQAMWTAGAHGIAVCLNLPWAFSDLNPPTPWDIPLDMNPTGEWMPGSYGGHCISGSAKVALLRGGDIPIQDLVGEKDLWVYGAKPTGEIVPACAREVVRTKQAKTIRIILDNNDFVSATPDHKFMMRDGTYREARFLKTGDRLMPLRKHIRKDKGYEVVRWHNFETKKRTTIFTHRLVANMMGCPPELVVHHKDESKANNVPSNLDFITQPDHMQLHQPWRLSSMTGKSGWFSTSDGKEYLKTMDYKPLIKLARERGAIQKLTRTVEPCGYCGVLVERLKSFKGIRYCSKDHYVKGRWSKEPELTGVNHRIVAIEEDQGEQWTYDLIGVNPTNNFSVNGIVVHNSMWARDYDEQGIWLVHTWDLPDQLLTWRAAAIYLDEAHLVIDSFDYWRKKKPQLKKFLDFDGIKKEVNKVSSYKIK